MDHDFLSCRAEGIMMETSYQPECDRKHVWSILLYLCAKGFRGFDWEV